MVWVWISSSSILKQLENNGVIVKNERGGSLFLRINKKSNRSDYINSFLSNKKNWEKKLFVVADKSALWDTYFFSTQISSSLGLPELKIKQNYVQQIIVFLNETEEGE